jgi:glyoxylase-like metal-dependent hydrolase (beta-lactamase superfamily II)
LKVKKLVLGSFNVNCYIVETEGSTFIIDPGADFVKIDDFLKSEKIVPEFILNTHGHADHIGSVPAITEAYKILFYIHSREEPIITDPDRNMSSFFGGNALSLKTYKLIDNDALVFFKKKDIEIFDFPGHTPGSIAIRINDSLFTGDFLFNGGIGRTDLPGGNSEEMLDSLRKIKRFSRDLAIFPGHGENSDLGREIENNFYLSDDFMEGKGTWL